MDNSNNTSKSRIIKCSNCQPSAHKIENEDPTSLFQHVKGLGGTFPETILIYIKNKFFSLKSKCKRLSVYPFLRKIDTQISLVIYAIVIFGCNSDPVYYASSVESKIEIIGKETCNPKEEENFWLVNVESTIGPKKKQGIKAVIGEKEYDNVVKTKFDFSEYNKNEKYYIVTVSELTSMPYPCWLPEEQLSPSNVKQIQMITIRHVDTKPRSL